MMSRKLRIAILAAFVVVPAAAVAWQNVTTTPVSTQVTTSNQQDFENCPNKVAARTGFGDCQAPNNEQPKQKDVAEQQKPSAPEQPEQNTAQIVQLAQSVRAENIIPNSLETAPVEQELLVSLTEAHRLIEGCKVKALEGSVLELWNGSIAKTNVPPHDLIEAVSYAQPHCPRQVSINYDY